MKFSCSVEINLPKNKVAELFNNPDNLKEWQDGFLDIEHLSGTPGTKGAKSKMIYKIGKREMILEETILVNNLPDEFTGSYEAKEMKNTMKNIFISTSENTTCWDAELEYLEFRGFMPKLMAKLMPGMFKNQTQKWLNQFKIFAEK
ncbi:MAG: SRPBCC family protein [Prolixibacteraceae bacterium]|mgnify:FL=1|jgi:hypothetical protein|nr:SRPBCC family protein [Prolixibacteraceae bacterium]MBT6764390.1 SRPBCC family protein [Prolixibacteraceae bacterium]MBT6999416.1 SRPBCC family protein [Prolixibacteraceae bacterium]MBT7394310.1 SRPBCC family protein [Prolixibacteraceae bacterium]